ncbi:MAG: MurR/RpiR family transcriptional regulator [Lachnotalea sp.]
MFSYDVIQKFNETEFNIYKYIMANSEKILYMTIRELAKELNMSPSTILRFCHRVNCDGYTEFKNKLKQNMIQIETAPMKSDLQEILRYFQGTNTIAFEQKIGEGADIIRNTDMVIFVGGGSSGTLARYGARYFSNLGIFSLGLEDTNYPSIDSTKKAIAIVVLSVSGETKEIINFMNRFQDGNCKILSITNQSNSTIAKMSDWNISYQVKQQMLGDGYNATTQVPVLFLMEALARRI